MSSLMFKVHFYIIYLYSMSVDCLPESLKIVDCEKRRGVARYYCYIIEVTRKNGDTYHIYRRYRQFDKMVNRLEERFPVEAGSIRASDRIIPPLPGQLTSIHTCSQ